MDENKIQEKVLAILKDELCLKEDIDKSASLIQNKSLDSMDWMSFLTILEDEFEIEISNEEADEYEIGFFFKLIDFIKMKLEKKG